MTISACECGGGIDGGHVATCSRKEPPKTVAITCKHCGRVDVLTANAAGERIEDGLGETCNDCHADERAAKEVASAAHDAVYENELQRRRAARGTRT